MAAFNFPSAPSLNDTHTENGATFKWNGTLWRRVGDLGAQGVQGATGSTGPQGVQGAQGNQGVQGSTGPQGVQGSTGPQGNQGVQGAQGDDGADSSVAGPQGVQGATGPQGNQGRQGAQGVQGADGADSSVAGPTGPQGVQGATGSAGADGPTGPQGNQGVQGATGSAGSNGPTGPQGDDGADSSVAGPTGPTGPQGVQGATGSSANVDTRPICKQTVYSTATSISAFGAGTFGLMPFSVDITPTATSSKILIEGVIFADAYQYDYNFLYGIRRTIGGSDTNIIPADNGFRRGTLAQNTPYNNVNYKIDGNHISAYLDSPNTTSTVTYKFFVRHQGSATQSYDYYINRDSLNSNNANGRVTYSRITVTEVKS